MSVLLSRPGRSILHRQPYLHHRALSTTPQISFAFDIDGVLLRSSKPIPGAPEALKLLDKHKIPFILLTNGGGLPEKKRVESLSKHLGITISEDQFIQSHTPWKAHPEEHRYENVLVCGGIGDTCRKVAVDYGFKNVVIPFDILATDPAVWPYHKLTPDEQACTLPVSKRPVDAIYVYHDPRDWGLDSQVILDLLLSQDGVIGTRQEQRIIESGQARQAMPIFFSNPDLLWANAYDHPRFGQGAFRILIEGLWQTQTSKKLEYEQIGKPSRITYQYARSILKAYHVKQHNRQTEGEVYMVGDNKHSDIQGANDFGWSSILVQTGVFRGTPAEATSGTIAAKCCAADVFEAVSMVLKKHGIV